MLNKTKGDLSNLLLLKISLIGIEILPRNYTLHLGNLDIYGTSMLIVVAFRAELNPPKQHVLVFIIIRKNIVSKWGILLVYITRDKGKK